VHEGYLTINSFKLSFLGDYHCELEIPNQEIGHIFSKDILSKVNK
jgi:hypothetical protein